VQQPQPLEIEQALAAGRHLLADRLVEADMLARRRAEGADQRHVANHVGQLALDPRRLVGKAVMQGRTRGRQLEQRDDQDRGDAGEDGRHRNAHHREIGDGAGRRHTRRQHVPHEQILDREGGIRGRGDAARERACQSLGEVARRMTGEVPEQLAAQIAAHAHEGMAGNPSAQPPQQIVGRDQGDQDHEGDPDSRMRPSGGERIDQELDRILGAYGATHGAQDGDEDRGMRQRPAEDIAQQERDRASGVVTKAEHRLSLMLQGSIRRHE